MGKLGRAIRLAWGLGGVFFAAVKACMTHRITSMSAALAFCTLFSMAPILVLVMATAGFLLGAQAAQGAIAAQLQAVMGATGARAIQNLVAGAQVPGSGARATTIAVVLLAVGATTVFAELKDSLDEIWKRQAPVRTGVLAVLRTRMLACGLVLALSFLLVTSLVVNTALAILASFWEGLWAGSYWIFYSLSALFTFTVIACLFAVIYKMLPEVALPWSDVTIGALCNGHPVQPGRIRNRRLPEERRHHHQPRGGGGPWRSCSSGSTSPHWSSSWARSSPGSTRSPSAASGASAGREALHYHGNGLSW
jgi:membrane protein